MTQLQTLLKKQRWQEAVRRFKDSALTDPDTIRRLYGNKPITLLKLINPKIRFPKKLRQIFAMLWYEQNEKGKPAVRFIIKGPRGGGKSVLLGAIGFAKWFFQSRSIVDMGGSLAQAQNVYNYFAEHCYSHDGIITGLPKEPLMQSTKSDQGNYFKAVAASPKQVRGPHPDCLFCDEACETKDQLILDALPMINTSPTPLVVMTSTFHKIFGLFQEIWDNADNLGYVRFSWDIFDVTRPFDPGIWDDPQLKREISDFEELKKRSQGRTGDPEGWVSIHNIIQAWREKSSVDWFDVEYMGSRPSAAGMVNDPEDVDKCTIPSLSGFPYKDGATVIGGLDWGFSSMTAWVELMGHVNQVKVNNYAKSYTQTQLSVIIEDIVERVKLRKIRFIYADSAGKFENEQLQSELNRVFARTNHKCTVIPVVFSKEKDFMVGNYRTHFQRHLLRIPKEFREPIWQHKRYRYQEGSDKPAKGDDHFPDATMCALQHWPLGKRASALPKSNLNQRPQRSQDFDRDIDRDGYGGTITGGLMDEIF